MALSKVKHSKQVRRLSARIKEWEELKGATKVGEKKQRINKSEFTKPGSMKK